MDENLTPIIINHIRSYKLWLNYRALECVKAQFGARQGHCTALELQRAAICSTRAITGSTKAATGSNEDPIGLVAGPGSDGSTLDPTGATQQNWSGVGLGGGVGGVEYCPTPIFLEWPNSAKKNIRIFKPQYFDPKLNWPT